MELPAGSPPWFGLDADTLRFLEIHQARAVAIPGRAWRDLGDAALLFSAGDSEPFSNRLTAVRWPNEPAAFDRRLNEVVALFDALGRRPYIWTIPQLTTPIDIADRLAANGFVNLGGGHDMLLVRDPFEEPDVPLPPGVSLERWDNSSRAEIGARAADLALVIGEAFGMPLARRPGLVTEVGLTLTMPEFHAYLVRVDGEPAATGQRYTFDDASYLSSIGTRPAWRGRGLARLLMQALARDSLAAGARLVYLGVHAENERAIGVYERSGFAILGPRSADMLLR